MWYQRLLFLSAIALVAGVFMPGLSGVAFVGVAVALAQMARISQANQHHKELMAALGEEVRQPSAAPAD